MAKATRGRAAAGRRARTRATRMAPEDRRDQLLECAVEVFARRGIGRGGHAEVAARARVAVATVFAYFRTREELQAAVLAEVAHEFEALADRCLNGEGTAPRALVEFAAAFAASVDERPHHTRVLLEWSTSIREEIWPLYLAFHERMRRRLQATVRRGQREGLIAVAIDAETSSLILIGVGHLITQMRFTHWPRAKVLRFQHATLRSAIGADALAAALA